MTTETAGIEYDADGEPVTSDPDICDTCGYHYDEHEWPEPYRPLCPIFTGRSYDPPTFALAVRINLAKAVAE